MKRIYDIVICLAALSSAVSCGYHTPVEKASSQDDRGQDASPASLDDNTSAKDISLPLAARTTFNVDHEHGCSQSFETTGISGEATLEATADGAASFSLEWSRSVLFGPSVGRYMEGDRDYSTTRSKHRSTWSGRARRDGDGLLFEFNKVEAASVDLPEYGDLPFPSSDAGTTAFTLGCSPTVVQAYAPPTQDGWALAMPAKEESPRTTAAIACAPSAKLFDMADLVMVDGRLVMSRGDGLIVSSWTMYWDSRQAIRLAPPASPSPGTP